MQGSFFIAKTGYPNPGLMKGLTSEGLMGSVAKSALLGVLAGAEIDRAIGLGLVGHRRETRTLMGAVAERLALAVAARAPVVGLAGFDEDRDGRLLRDVGGHRMRVLSLEYGV
jgi:NADH:ubiquinone oxidoreductase subunit K